MALTSFDGSDLALKGAGVATWYDIKSTKAGRLSIITVEDIDEGQGQTKAWIYLSEGTPDSRVFSKPLGSGAIGELLSLTIYPDINVLRGQMISFLLQGPSATKPKIWGEVRDI